MSIGTGSETGIWQLDKLRGCDFSNTMGNITDEALEEIELRMFKSLRKEGYKVLNCENKIIAKDKQEFLIYI